MLLVHQCTRGLHSSFSAHGILSNCKTRHCGCGAYHAGLLSSCANSSSGHKACSKGRGEAGSAASLTRTTKGGELALRGLVPDGCEVTCSH